MQEGESALSNNVKLASRVFRVAAIYGVIVLAPLYLAPVPDPWRLTHFGFIGTALVFQGVFWLISRDPERYAALIPLGIMEKLVFGVPAVIFVAMGRADPIAGFFGGLDLFWAAMFAFVWLRMRSTS